MQLSAKGAAFMRHHEGFVGKAYRDPVDVLTIGIGFTWRSGAFREWWAEHRPGEDFDAASTMTRSEAEEALRYLVDREYGAAVEAFLGKDVAQHVYDGMASPVFNLGPGSLDWKWAAACKRGDYAEAADLLEHTGTTASGRRLKGLVTRRREEAELIEHGDYTIGAPVSDPMADGMLVRGERGDAVKTLQRDLANRGHYDGKIDGIFGPGTESAVMAFQRSAGLADDGYAGPKTLSALEKATGPAGTAEPEEPKTDPKPEEPSMPSKPNKKKPNVARYSKLIGAFLGMATTWAVAQNLIPPDLISQQMIDSATPLLGALLGVFISPKNAE